MNDSVTLSQAAPKLTSQNYADLRERGMAFIRELAKESWTDHNVHDPGITLLEAFCYAMTELGFRIQLEIPDLIQSGSQYAKPDWIPAHRVLPCAPVTPRDLQSVLLDNRLIRHARIITDANCEIPFFEDPSNDPPFSYSQNAAAVKPRGLYEVVLEFAEPERDLNSNSYIIVVNVDDVMYKLDLALPYWDENVAQPFQQSTTINSVTLLDDNGKAWRALQESQSYFGNLEVNVGNNNLKTLWVVLRIVNELTGVAAATLDNILLAAQSALETIGPTGLIDSFAQRVRSAYSSMQQVERYLASYRNLSEDLVVIGAARIQELGVRARIEVNASGDLEQLLAEIFFAIDRMLAPSVRFSDFSVRRSAGAKVEDIFDGPLLRNGILVSSNFAANEVSAIYVSDILRLIMRRRGTTGTDLVAQENPSGRFILAVTDLALSNYINNRPLTIDAPDCLRLVEIERYRPRLSLAKSRIRFVRNDTEVAYDMAQVESLYTKLQQADEATSFPVDPSPLWHVASGQSLPIDDYIPLQNELPRMYGVGEAQLPDSVSSTRKATVLQLKGYLLLFEQFLADLTSQLGNINRFFSADPAQQVTYFSRALYELPGVQKLLMQFPPGTDWTSFVTDAENPYGRALQSALEDREHFLDRRNRMLDHLLARQGEDLVTYGQELHRYAQLELQQASISPLELPTLMASRRQAANARLIRAKAALLGDVPRLNNLRLQAFGNPLQADENGVKAQRNGSNFYWTLALGDAALLQGTEACSSRANAIIAAEEAVVLASQSAFYSVVSADAGRQRYQLHDAGSSLARTIGESPQSYASVTAAQNAAMTCAQRFFDLRIAMSLTPLEQRIAHLCGIRSQQRRRLSVSIDRFFEIYDEVDNDGIIEKRWRLWELPNYAGRVLLSSVFHFQAETDTEAIAAAKEAIANVLRDGQDEWNYKVSSAGVNSYNFELWHPKGDKIAMRHLPFPSAAATRAGIDDALAHLYHFYSAEGFHLVEHILLRPREPGQDQFLSFPSGRDLPLERDPYSQRLSLVLASGWSRDFSLATKTAPRFPAEPHRFRDLEFRRHLERMVQQACPAHLLVSIFWVDRQRVDTVDAVHSFEGFEQAYFAWLETLLIPGAAKAAALQARSALILALNGIAHG